MSRSFTLFFVFLFQLCIWNQFTYSQNNTVKNRISGKDSIVINNLGNKIKRAYKKNELDSAILFSKEIITIGVTKNDTSSMINGYFKMAFYQKKSSYLTAALETYLSGINLALKSGDSLNAAKMLLNLTTLQNEMGDYNGAQVSATSGIPLINKTNDPVLNINLYQGLGNSFQEMMDYKNAISCYNKALGFAEIPEIKAGLLNNVANCYRKSDNLPKALNTYQTALSDSIKMSSSTLARILDNYGFAQFQNNPNTGLPFLERGLSIRKKDSNKLGIITSYLHLGYWHLNKNKAKALQYAAKANKLSKEINTVDVEVESLKLLVQLKNNPKQESKRLVLLQDSITTSNLQNFHKAVGVRFRTQEKEKENLSLKQQNTEQALLTENEKTQKRALGGGLMVSLAALGIFFLVYRKNQKQKKEIELQKNKVENLQKELHHRLKNNLSFIDVFISLAKGKFTDVAYQEKLNELQNRIKSMFEVHEQLYNKETITGVNATTYISKLADNVKAAYSNNNISIEKDIKTTEELDSQTSFPIGIIINEFVTNSYKYAFRENEKGIIKIELKDNLQDYVLSLSDNGKGLPSNFEVDNIHTFGLDSIKLLTQEYKGTFAISSKNGVTLNITLPKRAA